MSKSLPAPLLHRIALVEHERARIGVPWLYVSVSSPSEQRTIILRLPEERGFGRERDAQLRAPHDKGYTEAHQRLPL